MPTVTRKQFLSSLAISLASVSVTSARGALLEPPRELFETSAAGFRKLVGTVFSLERPDGSGVELVLERVTTPAFPDPNEQFSLELLASDGRPADGTYTFRHPALGQMQMFIRRSQIDAKGTHYRADFNLLRSPGARKR